MSHPAFSMTLSICLHLSSVISNFVACRILGIWQSRFVLFCILQSQLVVLLVAYYSQELCESSVCAGGVGWGWGYGGVGVFNSLDKRLLYKFFLDNPVCFCLQLRWLWGSVSHMHNPFKEPFMLLLWVFYFSEVLSKHCLPTFLGFCVPPPRPEHSFGTLNLLIFVPFAIWIGWSFPKSSYLGSILFNSSSLNLSLSSHILL